MEVSAKETVSPGPSRKYRGRKRPVWSGDIRLSSKRKTGQNPAYAAFQTSVITRPLSCVARNTFRQLLSM